MSLYERVKQLVARELDLDPDQITPSSHFERDLGCSLDVIEIFMACEEEFGVEIADADAPALDTVGKLASYIEAQLSYSPDRESPI